MNMRKLILAAALYLGALACLLSPTAAQAANRFGVCTVTCTWDGASTAMWSASSGGATGASVPGVSDAVIFDGATCVGGVTCTITVNTAVTVQSITMGACTGATTGCIVDFSANNPNLTMASFSGTGAGTRTLNMGNGTWTLTATSTNVWDYTTVTGLTHNANSSTLTFSGITATNTRNFQTGGKTFNIVNISQAVGTIQPSFDIVGGGTIATLNLTAPLFLRFNSAQTVTITNAFNWAGASGSILALQSSAGAGTNATVSVASGSPTIAWGSILNLTFTGGATFSATNSFNLGGNQGITITAPSAGGGRVIGG